MGRINIIKTIEMKNINSIIFITLLFFGCKNEAKETNKTSLTPMENLQKQDSSAINQIREFYNTFYASEKPTNDEKLLKKYISLELINKIDHLRADGENLILDYDPFIQGQDYNYKTVIKTMEILPLKNKDEYQVSFYQFGNKNEKKTTIIYQVIKENEGYKINNILSDTILNPQKTKISNTNYYELENIPMSEGKVKYKISVLEKNENKQSTQHNSNPVIIYRDNKKLFVNNNIIFSYVDNCPADGFQRIVSKNNFFTIEQVYCKDFMYVQSYTTFKISNNNITLHKYGEEYTDRSNPDKDIESVTKTEKDFGKINFENITADFLLQLIK